jgi:predicted nuclease of restriction endonuclease-like (RecB) superfamily
LSDPVWATPFNTSKGEKGENRTIFVKYPQFLKMSLSIDSEYKDWLRELKANIKKSQIKASLAVNSELIQLYWNLGKQIVEKQENTQWGSGFIDQLSKDLREEFPNMGGFSYSNLKYCRQFYLFYSESLIRQQLVGELEDAENQDIAKIH